MENPRFATESACGGLLDVIVHGLMLVITNGLPGPTSAACSSPVFLVGAESWRVGVGSRFGSPIAQRRPQGDLDAAAGSGTMGSRGKTAMRCTRSV
jgi:hypothetical protein